jgi:hypothetical protein
MVIIPEKLAAGNAKFIAGGMISVFGRTPKNVHLCN